MFLSVFMAVFSVIGGIDLIFGDKLGLGKEFKKGFMLFGYMALSMIGMIVISPLLCEGIKYLYGFISRVVTFEPSIIPAMLLANDMGGASLSVAVAENEALGLYNGLVVTSMMGCTISFTIPFALNLVKKELHKEVLLGLLCGIAVIPIGCIVSGLVLGIGIVQLLLNLVPMIIFSAIIVCGLIFAEKITVKIFGILGKAINILIVVGLLLGIIRFLTGFEVIKNLATLEEGAAICLNASVVMTGAFPFLFIVSRLISKPLKSLAEKLNISEMSSFGLFSTLATSMTTFEMANDMDKKGIVLNSAFAVSAGFTFAGHLAFTMAFNREYVFAVIIGKLISGVAGLLMAIFIYNRIARKTAEADV